LHGAFAQYAASHEAAWIQRCWSTWNLLCTFLYTSELITANPMRHVGRPKTAKTLRKGPPRWLIAPPCTTASALLSATADPSPAPGWYSGPNERGITWHPVVVSGHPTRHDVRGELPDLVEAGLLSTPIAETLPAHKAALAHQKLEAGGVRGRIVLTR
jgi:zinc-binding alcohol dehydrogenase family protein